MLDAFLLAVGPENSVPWLGSFSLQSTGHTAAHFTGPLYPASSNLVCVDKAFPAILSAVISREPEVKAEKVRFRRFRFDCQFDMNRKLSRKRQK